MVATGRKIDKDQNGCLSIFGFRSLHRIQHSIVLSSLSRPIVDTHLEKLPFYANRVRIALLLLLWYEIVTCSHRSLTVCDGNDAFMLFYDFLMISTRAHRSSENFLLCMIAGWHAFWYVFFFSHSLLSLQCSLADDVEVVKSVSPDEVEKRDENTDQVALETVEQEVKALPPPNHIVQVQGEC